MPACYGFAFSPMLGARGGGTGRQATGCARRLEAAVARGGARIRGPRKLEEPPSEGGGVRRAGTSAAADTGVEAFEEDGSLRTAPAAGLSAGTGRAAEEAMRTQRRKLEELQSQGEVGGREETAVGKAEGNGVPASPLMTVTSFGRGVGELGLEEEEFQLQAMTLDESDTEEGELGSKGTASEDSVGSGTPSSPPSTPRAFPRTSPRERDLRVQGMTLDELKKEGGFSRAADRYEGNGTPPSAPSTPRSFRRTATQVLKKDVDIVLCHQTADFDSLAAAVGLAKLRGPQTVVVCPGGEHPTVRRFLALHRQLFRIVHPKAIDPARLRWVGVVDTVRKERLGVAADWTRMADEVVVFDHHQGRHCDIVNDKKLELVIEDVGALATVITERLVARNLEVTPAEATLLALGIHTDTGSLTYEQTTPRDARMLTWLMEHGALQRAIAEFSQSCLTDSQQQVLSQGLSIMERRNVNGHEIGSVMLSGSDYLRGMSTVTQDLLELSNVDVLLVCYINCRGRARNQKGYCSPENLRQVSIIGRARARVTGVDFRKSFQALGGGGHPRAASVSIKASEAAAAAIVEQLIEVVISQIPEAPLVEEIMERRVLTVSPDTKLADARDKMDEHEISGLPVVDGEGKLIGILARHDVKLAERKNPTKGLRLAVKAFMHQKVISASPSTPIYAAERLLAENCVGRLPIVDDSGKVVGIITRTDVLVHRGLWTT